MMRSHSILGASIVNAVEPLRDLVPIVRSHHERYDGAGYPDELGGDLVPIEAYVVAAADAFEVIVSRRAYKPAQTVEHACAELLRIICDAMGYENGFLLTLDDAGEHLVIRAAVGPSGSYVGQRLPKGQGISWWVVERGELQNVADGRLDPRFYGPTEIRSVLCVPLQLGDERIGALGVESPRIAAFSREDEDLLTAVSHQVAAAVRVAKLHQAAKTAAATDPLTGLPNRRSFFQRLECELAARDGASLSVAIVDANGLKAL